MKDKMRSLAVCCEKPPLSLLSQKEIERIHEASLRLMADPGVRVDDREAQELLRAAGAQVGDDGVARIPAGLVERALQSAPKSFMVYDRQGEPAMLLQNGYSYFGGGSDTVFTINPDTGAHEQTSCRSVCEFIALMDALPNYDFVMSMGTASELPADRRDTAHFYAMLTHSTKPILFTAQEPKAMERIARMCAEARGSADAFRDKPFAVLYAMPTAPLIHSREALRDILISARAGIPCLYGSAPMQGSTGPVTVAGMLLLSNVETLTGLVLHQLACPGAPYVYAATLGPLEMRTMVNIYNGPESMLMQGGSVALGRYYGLPTFATAGCSDSKLFDGQAAAECALSLMNAVQSGGVVVHDVGYLESGLCSSMEMAVFADELIGQLRFMLRGIRADDGHLLEEEIRRCGIGGHFMLNDSTLDRHEEEIWYPSLIDHNNYQRWREKGAKPLKQRVSEKLASIRAGHSVPPLPEDLSKRLRSVAGVEGLIK